jgi:hypothetical protein
VPNVADVRDQNRIIFHAAKESDPEPVQHKNDAVPQNVNPFFL